CPVRLLPEHRAGGRILESHLHEEIDPLLIDEALPEREDLESVAANAAFDDKRRGADVVDQGQAVGLQELPPHELSDTPVQAWLAGPRRRNAQLRWAMRAQDPLILRPRCSPAASRRTRRS